MNGFSGFWICHNCQNAIQISPEKWSYDSFEKGGHSCNKDNCRTILTPLLDKEVVFYLTKFLKNRQIARDFFQSIQI